LTAAPDRIGSLDLIRGIAVLGILTVNIAGFAGPPAATVTPHIPQPAGVVDEAAFAVVFVLFEGKMRALFTMLFGASLLLFIDRAEASGRHGDLLQLRRLGWLLLFGLLHYFLFWWGDILFIYAVAGFIALFLRELPTKPMVIAALAIFSVWHLAGALAGLPGVRAEEHVRLGIASANQAQDHAQFLAAFTEQAARQLAETRLGFFEHIGLKLRNQPFGPLETALPNLAEILPLTLIGMALLRSGFFSGEWPRRQLAALAAIGCTVGAALTLAELSWLWPRGFPPRAMSMVLSDANALPHLLMALGYAALLAMAAPRLAATALGKRLVAAGRMAFTNYIMTTVVMTAIFYGWGLGLAGSYSTARQMPFVLLGWALMLGLSLPWLGRFHQGPLEWLWRSLTERRLMPMRRRDPLAD
jgi:uncharacterized protein